MTAGCTGLGFVVVVGMLLTSVFPRAAQAQEPGGDAKSAQLAVQDPDEYAWQLFLFINRQAARGRAGVADPTKSSVKDYDDDQDVVWETWALASREGKPEAEVFRANGATPVRWEDLPRQGPAAPKALDKPLTPSGHVATGAALAVPNEPESDEVRMNRATFDHILDKTLYSRAGLIDAFRAAGQDRDFISFPPGAKEVKAAWREIREDEKRVYHWREINKKIYGLVAFHVITKDAPMWFWADFVHKDLAEYEVPGSFHDSATGPDGIRAQTLGSKWEHYRLKGTQLTFTNSRGEFTVLGNQIIENGMAAKSTCIGCHAYASVSANGQDYMQREFKLELPQPQLFGVPGMLRLQTDFMYSVAIRAQPRITP